MKSLQATLSLLLILAVALAVALFRIPVAPEPPREPIGADQARAAAETLAANLRLAFTLVGHIVVFAGLLAGYFLWRLSLGKRVLRSVPGKTFLLISVLPALAFFVALFVKPAGDVYAMFLPLFGSLTPLFFCLIVAVFAFLLHSAISLAMAGDEKP